VTTSSNATSLRRLCLLAALIALFAGGCGSDEDTARTTTVTEIDREPDAGATGATGATGAIESADLSESEAEDLVRSHYRELNRGRFGVAWEDFGDELQAALGPYSTFVDGYTYTEGTFVDRAAASTLSQRRAVVEVDFSSDDLDACGEHVRQRFTGTWTVEVGALGSELVDAEIDKVSGGEPIREEAACPEPPPDPKPPRVRLENLYGPSYVPDPTPPEVSGFCATHDCIPNFENGDGYVVQCEDGTWSQSGGIQGACSWHGGVRD
jgi:hypothetical protein